MFMSLVCWMALGLVAGFIASRLINQAADDPKLGIVLAGVAAVIGGIVYTMFAGTGMNVFNARSMIGAVVGAAVGVGAWNLLRGYASRA
jgi:uncharacterized membrane protein YeaQ/YmgE (transglycosylase-associated protein family)